MPWKKASESTEAAELFRDGLSLLLASLAMGLRTGLSGLLLDNSSPLPPHLL
jgi:hypothetical protein